METWSRRMGRGLFTALGLGLAAAGCVDFHEVQHLVAVDEQTGDRNYFRVTVRGHSYLSSSQFASGWYDADAVEMLFGELEGTGKHVRVGGTDYDPRTDPPPKPTDPKTAPLAGDTKPAATTKAKEHRPATPKAPVKKAKLATLAGQPLDNKRYVMFLATNANSLTAQISSLANGNELADAIADLLLGKESEQLVAARKATTDRKANDHQLANRLEETGKELDANAGTLTADQLSARLLEVVRTLAARSNQPEDLTALDTPEHARAWLDAHVRAFLPKEQP